MAQSNTYVTVYAYQEAFDDNDSDKNLLDKD